MTAAPSLRRCGVSRGVVVMNCAEARQLFDAYLDGELAPTLALELGAHRVKCPECRRALAILEVTGHIIASDRDPVSLQGDFQERLLACVNRRGSLGWHRARRFAYVGGPIAAAAVVALAFLGVFDRPAARVAGHREQALDVGIEEYRAGSGESTPAVDVANERLEAWIERTEKNIDAKRKSGESLQQALDLTVRQLLDVLREPGRASESPDHPIQPDATPPHDAPHTTSPVSGEVEDL